MFTSCKGICPATNKSIGRILDNVESENFKVVSISSDPKIDTPEVLEAYRKKFSHGKDNRWVLLTGEKSKTIKISENIFKLAMEQDPNSHSPRSVLVDENMRIRGYYNLLSSDEVDKTILAVRQLVD